MQTCCYRRVSKFWGVFEAENTVAEDLAIHLTNFVSRSKTTPENLNAKTGLFVCLYP